MIYFIWRNTSPSDAAKLSSEILLFLTFQTTLIAINFLCLNVLGILPSLPGKFSNNSPEFPILILLWYETGLSRKLVKHGFSSDWYNATLNGLGRPTDVFDWIFPNCSWIIILWFLLPLPNFKIYFVPVSKLKTILCLYL